MKQALCTVASSKRLANVQLLMESVAKHHPETSRVAYIMDIEEAYVLDGVEYRPIHTFFAEEIFLSRMFAYTEDTLETVVKIYAAKALLQTYEQVAFADWGVELLAPLPQLTKQHAAGTVVYFVDSKAKTLVARDKRFLLNQTPDFSCPLSVYSGGGSTQQYFDFCADKLTYLADLGIMNVKALGYKDTPTDMQTSFYTSWQYYAPAFGCGTEFERIENLSFFTNKVEGLPLHDHTQITLELEKLDRYISYALLPEKATPQEYRNEQALKEYSQAALTLQAEYDGRVQALGINSPYKYDTFADGIYIDRILRIYYEYNRHLKTLCGNNPFKDSALFLRRNALVGDTNLLLLSAPMVASWHLREDIEAAYPGFMERQRLPFLHWFVENAHQDTGLPQSYVEPVAQSIDAYRGRLAAAAAARPLTKKVTDKLKRLMGRPVQQEIRSYPDTPLRRGVNLCGFIRGDFGVAEACRILATSLEAAGIPFNIVEYRPHEDYGHSFTNHSWDYKITNTFEYDTNILLTNAAGTVDFMRRVAPESFRGRYNIGFWYWELPEFPTSWVPSAAPLDEIWTSSEFTAEAIRKVIDKPVSVVPCCVQVGDIKACTRADFGLAEDTFVFLMMYDARSYNERKNPQGALDAFLSKFEGNAKVQLAIKVSAPEDWDYNEPFMQTALQHSNIVLLKGTYPRNKVNALISCCDAFVSLHRSEGFGLGPAEAMYLGKPAVLTNWSGNTQYMTADNCCPVDCKVVEIRENFSEYCRGRHWADPDIAQAAGYMQRLVEDSEYYSRVADAGRTTIREKFSAKATGEIALARLRQLGRME